ncbi:MAG TPA: carboxypeptidase-like regulatory domain-containing protein, partial [Gemmatimonadales bacterium]|nr:carboxypeptidase-like regulatory domain-containing protein [Gemmatimonadales bacterium]
MHRIALPHLVLMCAMSALPLPLPHRVGAQQPGDPTEGRGPRFLLAMAERAKPVPVDLKRSAILRQPLSLAFDGATLKEALAEISRQAGLSLVYADDVLPVATLVNLRAEHITVAAALMDVLLDAGVDVVFTPEGRATLAKRPAGPALQLGTITGTVTASETRARLARATVVVVGTRLSAETDATGRYSISAVPVGTHRVRARMLGYAPVDTSVVVEDGKESVVDLQLKAQAIELEAVVAVG